jgi:Mor family transcriptional regulator
MAWAPDRAVLARNAAIAAEADAGATTVELAERHGLKINRVQQIIRVEKLRAKHAATDR